MECMGDDQPGAAGAPLRLTELRNGLLALHKTLLDSERAAYERDVRRIESNGELFGLVLNDPWFAWLRRLSALVAEIDHRLADKAPLTEGEAGRLVRRTRQLLIPDEAGGGFERRYFEAMQRDPGAVLAHAAMMRLLARLD